MSDSPTVARVTALHVYPVKGARGIPLTEAEVGESGIAHDRQWLVVDPRGRFRTQRELPRLALIGTRIADGALVLELPGAAPLAVPCERTRRLAVQVWGAQCAAFDCGDAVAAALSAFLGETLRLVEFDPSVVRATDPAYGDGLRAAIRFPDGYPLLLIGEGSLADLNRRLPSPLPMSRFRPNIVVAGLEPYAEDRVYEFASGALRLRPVKGCTRCTVTMTDQDTAVVDAAEPLRTLKTYRWDASLRGIAFGQNLLLAAGAGARLAVGDRLEVTWRH